MGKQKKKIVANPEKSKQKKAFRIPTSRPTEFHKDKSKYSRKKKHKLEEDQ